MKTKTRRAVLGTLALVAAAPAVAFAQATTVTLKGTILQHEGNRLLLKTGTGDARVRILDSTKIESVKGLVGLRRQDRLPTDLIRGLPIEAAGMMEGNELVASTITFDPDQYNTARQIEAGVYGTEQRLASVGELAAVGRTKVFFAVGSSTLSAKGKQDLQAIATKAKSYKGYRLAVVGRADPTGSVEANQRLSDARAAAVTAYLMHSCGVSPGSLLPQAALGEAAVFEDPDKPQNDAEARRVTVTIAVSKATLAPEY